MLVDDTVASLKGQMVSEDLDEQQYSLIKYLLAKEELSYSDVIILVMSLFIDGLSTVNECI